MSDETPVAEAPIPPRRRRRGRLGVLPVIWALLASALVAIGLLSFSGVPVKLPAWVASQVERALNARMTGPGIRIGQVEALVDSEGRPRVRLKNVEIVDDAGMGIAQLNELGAGLSLPALIRGRVEPEVLRLSGAQITVRRTVDGTFSLAFGGISGVAASGTLAGVLDAIDRFFATRPMAEIGRIEASDLTITLEDARSGRIWQATEGRLRLDNRPEGVTITVVSDVFNGTEDLANVQLSFRSVPGSASASLGVTFSNADARDIALQSPALAVLGLLDARISGSMRATVGDAGTLDRLAATLEIGAGALRPAPDVRPVRFDHASAYLTYDPAEGRIDFSEVSAQTELMSISAEGQAFLADLSGGWPQSLVGQFRLNTLDVAPGDLFDAPLSFSSGSADLRVRLDPFSVEIGQLMLDDGEAPRHVTAAVRLAGGEWEADVDLDTYAMSAERLLSYWPHPLAPNPRNWVSLNVLGGEITGLKASLRLRAGLRPVTALDYSFSDATVRVLPHFPPIVGGEGRASFYGGRYAMALTRGWMVPDEGAPADLAGSTFSVPDVRERPAPAEVDLSAAAPLSSLLRLLDNRPIDVLSKTPKPEELLAAAADARVTAEIRFPMKRRLAPEDVTYEVAGRLSGVSAEGLVPGRQLTSSALDVEVTPAGLTVSGPARLDALPVEGTFSAGFAPGNRGRAEVAAHLPLNEQTLAALGATLPKGSVTGEAEGEVRIALAPEGEPATFRLTSDLVGAGLSIPAVGWSKRAEADGSLEVTGRLAGAGVEVDRLALAAPGLSAEGKIVPGDAPGLSTYAFDRVRVGSWLDAPVTLRGRGPGRAPAVEVGGGRVDLRGLPASGTQGAGGAPLRLTLDRLAVTDSIAIAPFRAELTTGGGLSGSFEGRVNGATSVRGSLVPARNGTAVRILSSNGGTALADAGLFPNARDGDLEVILTPTGGSGRYDGQLRMTDVRLRDAPALAGLLDAISIVGIVDQLQGPGILFDTVEARFALSPERVTITQGSAVGASMGISLDGIYDIATRRLDFQGVISPLYLLNGIGQILTRPGEGLFGFSFRMTGTQGATRVQVNPLSILTPGMFRDIFRRPPPAPPQPTQ